MGRAPCCDKANVKKGPWSPEEDATLKSYIQEHGQVGNWIALPQKIGLKRCGKSCRLRWLNYLRPNIKHGGFSEEEDRIICSLYISIGSRWSIIAAQLPGRTDNDIKNYWNTKLKKKLFGKQRKKGNQAQKNSSKRGISMKKISLESYNCSATSATESGWSELRQGVTDVPLASMNQNPNLMTTSDPTSIWGLLAQFGGMVSPIQGLETDQINTDLQYPNKSDKIPPHGYYPFEHIAGRFTSSQSPVFSSINEDPTCLYKTSGMDSVDNLVDLYHNVLPDFQTNQVEYCGQQNLLQGPRTSNIYRTDEMMNISICSITDTLINNSHGNNIIWEDISSILADVDGACRPPLLSDYEAHCQSLGGRGRGSEDACFFDDESRLYMPVGQC